MIAAVAQIEGRYDDAEAAGEEALAHASTIEDGNFSWVYFANSGLRAIDNGFVAATFDLMKAVRADFAGLSTFEAALPQPLRAPASNEPSTAEGRRRIVRQGFLVGVTNPKMLVFFAAALPQFVDPSRGHVVVQMLVLLGVYSVMSLAGDTSWGYAGASMRSWSVDSPRRIERFIGAGGVCIIALGGMLALSHTVG